MLGNGDSTIFSFSFAIAPGDGNATSAVEAGPQKLVSDAWRFGEVKHVVVFSGTV